MEKSIPTFTPFKQGFTPFLPTDESGASWRIAVIYQCIKTQDDKKLGVDYARPLSMFLSEVDREKYPNSTEQYRFKRLF